MFVELIRPLDCKGEFIIAGTDVSLGKEFCGVNEDGMSCLMVEDPRTGKPIELKWGVMVDGEFKKFCSQEYCPSECAGRGLCSGAEVCRLCKRFKRSGGTYVELK